ncbi:SlyX family protein [Marinobacteraceae bacterium S3BR75-40.1]
MTDSELENRMMELETRVAFQDDLVTTLNDRIAEQENDIRKLWEANRLLKQQINELQEGMDKSPQDEAPPPHY